MIAASIADLSQRARRWAVAQLGSPHGALRCVVLVEDAHERADQISPHG